MAPFRTYSRNSNKPTVTSAQAFDMLFVNNLSLKKIFKKKPQTKIFKLRNFSKKLKSVLNDESLHVNVNDTFDRLLKVPQTLSTSCSSGSKISFSKLIPLGKVKKPSENSEAELCSFPNMLNGNKSDSNSRHLPQDTTAMSSYFANATPSDIAITESLEVVSDNAYNNKFVHSDKKTHSMVLRSSNSKKVYAAKNHLAVPLQNVSKSQVFKELSNDLKSELEFNSFLTSRANNIILHSSTPIRPITRKHVMVDPFSAINTTDQVSNTIVESVSELKSWAWSAPNVDHNSVKSGKLKMSQSIKDSQTSGVENSGGVVMEEELPCRLIMSVKCDTAIPSQSIANSNIQTFDKTYNISCSGHQSKSIVQQNFKKFYKDQITPDIFSQSHLNTSICSNYLEKSDQESSKQTNSLSEEIEELVLVKAQNQQRMAIHHTSHLSSTNMLKKLFVNLDRNVHFSKHFLANSRTSNQKSKQLYVNLSRETLPKLKTNCFTKYGVRKYLTQTCRKFSSNSSAILQHRNMQDVSLLSQKSLMDSMVTCFAKNVTELYGIHNSIGNENCAFKNASRQIGKKLSFGLPLDDTNSRILQNQNCSLKLPSLSTFNLSKSQTLYSSQSDISSYCLQDTNLNVSRMPEKDYIAQIISVSSDDCDDLADSQATCIAVKARSLNWVTKRKAYIAQDLYLSLKSEDCQTVGNVSSQIMLKDVDSIMSVNNVETKESVSLQAPTPPVCLDCNQKTPKEDCDKVFKFPNQPNLLTRKVSRTSLLHQRRTTIIAIDLTSTLNRKTSSFISPEKVRLSNIIEKYLLRGTNLPQDYAESSVTSNKFSTDSSLRITSLNDLTCPEITARNIILKYCEQTDAEAFEKLFPDSLLNNCKKIGEGTYGEVFMYKKTDGSSVVMKVIPIEGDVEINGERQKKFHEILPEATIASTLSQFRENKSNSTSAFCELQRLRCVKGQYPERLLHVWHEFDADIGSENECPDVFGSEQLYIVLEVSNAGQNLQDFVFNNAQQALSLFKQVTYALAIAEEEVEFEHRDLHLGNILVQKISKGSFASFKLKGRHKKFRTYGVKATIIDFTLSRMSSDGVTIFTDLADDPELFTSHGSYQFDIYRLMRNKTENNWKKFTPYTNVLWLHFLLVQSITAFRYRNTKTKVHNMCKCDLIKFRDSILNYNSVSEFVSCLE
ncbi:uncharacterized protein [Euwallacea similis]|uniref:uncharacterized protein n=1 Tax=Euwallacea similis TaxID=1736056 RepID=UPI00344CEF41